MIRMPHYSYYVLSYFIGSQADIVFHLTVADFIIIQFA